MPPILGNTTTTGENPAGTLTGAELIRGVQDGSNVKMTTGAIAHLFTPTSTLGDLIVQGASAVGRLGVGADGTALTADSTQPLGMGWAGPFTSAAKLASSANGSGVDLVGGASRVVGSINALRALLKTGVGRAFVTGYYAPADGGGGPYVLDSTDTTSSDNGGTIIVAADGGRWKLVVDTFISIKQFGAVADWNGTSGTDNAAKITAAYAAARALRKDVFVPGAPLGYMIGSPIELADSDYTTFFGEGGHYTASTIVVNFNGPGFHGASGLNITNGFRQLVLQGTNRLTNTGASGIKVDGSSVESYFKEVSFRDFGYTGAWLGSCFSVIVDHCLFAGNQGTGLVVLGGSGSTLTAPVFQDNYGSALNLQGSGHTVVGGFWEHNCKRNDPAGENASYREIYASDSNSTFVGGTINCYPQNNKYPIEVAGQEVTFLNVNPYSLGTGAPAWIFVNGSFASCKTIGCRSLTIAGTAANCVVLQDGSPGYFKPDVKLGGVSVSDGIAKVLVNFDGTAAVGAIAARASSGVASITKIGTGNYKVTYSTPFADANYFPQITGGQASGTNYVACNIGVMDPSYVQFQFFGSSGTVADPSFVSVCVDAIRVA